MIKNYAIDRIIILILFLISPLISFLGIGGANTIVSIIFIIIFFYYSQFKDMRIISTSPLLILWLTLTIYHWTNGMIKKVPEVDYLDLLHGLKIFSCISIFTYLSSKNFDQTIKSLLICFISYLLLSFVVNDISKTQLSGRMTGVIYATALGQTAALTGIYITYYCIRNKIGVIRSASYYILPIIVILLTQSRNSLAMMAIGIIGHTLALSSVRGANLRKTSITIVSIAILSYTVLNFVINNTALGNRLSDTETAQQSYFSQNYATNTIFDTIVGDRLVYYILGWKYFLDSPLTGIGMWNYEYVSQGNYPLHSEYMIHLSEGGIIASVLWILFIVILLYKVINSKHKTYIKIIALFSIIEILFCGIYARVFYYEFFYPIFGIAIALIYRQQKYDKKTTLQLQSY